MANVFLDKAGADKVIADVNTNISELEEVALKIDRLIANQLPQYWTGVSADKAQNTYAESYKDFLQRKVPEMVTELNNYMKTCVQSITEVDNQLAGN